MSAKAGKHKHNQGGGGGGGGGTVAAEPVAATAASSSPPTERFVPATEAALMAAAAEATASLPKSNSGSSHGHSHGHHGPTRPFKEPDHRLNGPRDYMALIPLSFIVLTTLFVLYLCLPGGAQWAPPVEHAQSFSGFEWPGRAVVGGYGGLRGDSATAASSSNARGSAGSIAYGGHHGSGGAVAGTRSWWAPYAGRKEFARKLRTALTQSPLAVVAGPHASGRSAAVASYVDSTRSADGVTVLPHTVNQRVGGVFTGGTASEYSVILWLDASAGHGSLHSQLLQLQAYLRIHSLRYDAASVLDNLHAWMYKQDHRVLLIFDNCNLEREELLRYIPRRNAHAIVVLTTPAGATLSSDYEQQDFSFDEPGVLVLPPLAQKPLARVMATISGGTPADFATNNASSADAKQLQQMFAHSPALAAMASLHSKRKRNTVALQLETATNPASALLATILETVATDLDLSLPASSEHSSRALQSAFVSLVTAVLPRGGGVHVPRIPRSDLFTAWAPSLDVSHPGRAVDALLRQWALYGLAAEQVVVLCGRRTTEVHFQPWVLEQFHEAAGKAKEGRARIEGAGQEGVPAFEFSTRVPASVWPLVRTLLLSRDGAYLSPLLTALASSSASSYSVHTSSVVAPNPQQVPPTPAPQRLFLSALGAIVHDEPASPLREVDATDIMQLLQRAYGTARAGSNQEHLACEVAWAASFGPAVGHLLASSGASSSAIASPSSAPVLSSAAEQARLDVLLLHGCYLLDVVGDAVAAQEAFRVALHLSDAWARRVAPHDSIMPNPLLHNLESKNGLSASSSHVLHGHPALTSPTVSVSAYTAASLSLLGVVQVFLLPADASDSSQTFQLMLDVALNYHRLALEIKRRVYAPSQPRQAGSTKATAESDLLHPAFSSTLSQLAHVYTLQRNLEQAKGFYSRSLATDLAMGLDPFTDEETHAALMRPPQPKAKTAAAGSVGADTDLPSGKEQLSLRPGSVVAQGLPLPLIFFPSSPRSRWERVLQQLKLVRDLSLLAHQECVMMYPSNALDLAQRAGQLEAGLFGEDSVGVAARRLGQGHLHLLAQSWKPAAQFYAQALELHKVLLPSVTDLRLVLAHFHAGKSYNSLGRGRAGKRSLELAAEHGVAALGGEVHPVVAQLLEPLADTSLALAMHEDSMGTYRRLLALWQTLRGDADPLTQHWRQRVLNLYTIMQQAQEEKQRKQMQMQQEQQRKLQEQRAQEQQAKKNAAAAAAAGKQQQQPTPKAEL